MSATEKKFYFLHGEGQVLEVREMTEAEAEAAYDQADADTNGEVVWSRGYTAAQLHEKLFGPIYSSH